jgi:hypothetical protein
MNIGLQNLGWNNGPVKLLTPSWPSMDKAFRLLLRRRETRSVWLRPAILLVIPPLEHVTDWGANTEIVNLPGCMPN